MPADNSSLKLLPQLLSAPYLLTPPPTDFISPPVPIRHLALCSRARLGQGERDTRRSDSQRKELRRVLLGSLRLLRFYWNIIFWGGPGCVFSFLTMGDVISSHLDEGKREIITARTGEVMGQFDALYEQQYSVALFNKVRFDVEGGGGPQPQLLHRKVPLENRCIFSGALFQYLEENRKWRNRFLFIPDSYSINYYDSKASHDRGLQPKGTLSCAGYKVLTSMEQYLELVANSLPGVKAKVGSAPFLKVATQFPLILWHPYGRHLYFCVGTEKEQDKWLAVFQDCVRHANDGLSEESRVQTPAFTDSVRLFRQAKGQYGTWDMMCGGHPQILSNLVMEILLPEIRDLISPRLKGKMHERQRNWMLISDAVYSLVQRQCEAQFRALEQRCEAGRPLLEASIRTDMDQIITSKEHVTNKIRGVVLSKADKLLKVSIQPYISSILEALMEPTSRGFSEVRDVFFRELVDMSKNAVNEGTKETVAEHMDKISMLAFHPVKMQSCYEQVERLSLDGLQQRFDVSSPSVFVQRAQILMREQMDDAVYTFEQILHQSLEAQGTEGLCKTIQRCQDRVIKKFDYDSSTVRKRFFREALLQIFIPYMLKQLTPSCSSDLPRFQELIFEDFTRFILVDSIFEEVVLHSVMKDIMTAVKDAAVQRRHNLYRDSIVLTSSDPNLHLLGDNPSIDWAEEYGAREEEREEGGADAADDDGAEAPKKRGRMKQVVSMIQVEGSPTLANASCLDVPGVDGIPEEEEEEEEEGDDEEQKEEVVDEEKDKEGGVPAGSPNSGCNGVAGGPADPGAPPRRSDRRRPLRGDRQRGGRSEGGAPPRRRGGGAAVCPPGPEWGATRPHSRRPGGGGGGGGERRGGARRRRRRRRTGAGRRRDRQGNGRGGARPQGAAGEFGGAAAAASPGTGDRRPSVCPGHAPLEPQADAPRGRPPVDGPGACDHRLPPTPAGG
ncbi:protein Niban 2b [Gadus macrocephalus]|uniref:protein Niban 2b n=1 Tax=Gadus macrocephalus TaxID=80720 RepID=UPI0028CB777B|nr:protein Niban 2b [Gadus macrocephalus]